MTETPKIEQKTTRTTKEVKKKSAARSPAYPAIDLESAVSKAEKIYEQERLNSTTLDVVAQHWNTNTKSSGFLQSIAALKYYGLASEVPDAKTRMIKLTDAAFRILFGDDDSAERLTALRQAALSPKLFKNMWDKWGKELPSEATMRSYLIFENKYNDSIVKNIIRNYKNTVSYSRLIYGNINGDSEDEMTIEDETLLEEQKSEQYTSSQKKQPLIRELTIPLPTGVIATLKAPFPMTKNEFAMVEAFLKAMKPSLVKDE
jgi:hypothetical protein